MNSFQQSLYMTVEQVKAHAKKYSKNFDKYGTGLWKEEFDLMAKKTVLKLLLNRYGVLSVEIIAITHSNARPYRLMKIFVH